MLQRLCHWAPDPVQDPVSRNPVVQQAIKPVNVLKIRQFQLEWC